MKSNLLLSLLCNPIPASALQTNLTFTPDSPYKINYLSTSARRAAPGEHGERGPLKLLWGRFLGNGTVTRWPALGQWFPECFARLFSRHKSWDAQAILVSQVWWWWCYFWRPCSITLCDPRKHETLPQYVVLMLGQRRRRWPNMKTTLIERRIWILTSWPASSIHSALVHPDDAGILKWIEI